MTVSMNITKCTQLLSEDIAIGLILFELYEQT